VGENAARVKPVKEQGRSPGPLLAKRDHPRGGDEEKESIPPDAGPKRVGSGKQGTGTLASSRGLRRGLSFLLPRNQKTAESQVRCGASDKNAKNKQPIRRALNGAFSKRAKKRPEQA